MTDHDNDLQGLHDLFEADRKAGRHRRLAEYLRLFPEPEALVVNELLTLRAAGSPIPNEEPKSSGDRYRLIRKIKNSPHESVWLAEDVHLGRQVALKLLSLPPGRGSMPRKLRSALEKAAGLDDPGICRLLDIREDENGLQVAMTWIPGSSLQERVDAPAHDKNEILARCSLVAGIARAAHAAHKAGVFHGNLKPSNVIVTPEGQPVVLDFGLGRSREKSGRVSTYFSPERTHGAAASAASDVFALGVILYEAMSGRPPFAGPTAAALTRSIRRDEPPAPSVPQSLHKEVDAVLQAALQKNPLRRYASAGAMADDLERLVHHQPVQAARGGAMPRALRWMERNRWAAIAMAAGIMALGVGFGVTRSLVEADREERERQTGALRLAGVAQRQVQSALGDFQRLGDSQLLRKLQAPTSQGWTPDPAQELTTEGAQAWCAAADALLMRRPLHENTLHRLRIVEPKNQADLFQLGALERLVGRLQRLSEQVTRTRRRTRIVQNLESICRDDAQVDWRDVEQIAANPSGPYRGIPLPPIPRLVPLGPDPTSGLLEFADPITGHVPVRHTDGTLATQDDTGVVFVLLPGGSFSMGADSPEAGPVHTVALAPFLIAKYELTRHQARELGCELRAGSSEALRLPIEKLTWEAARNALARMKWLLPTEAQWEYACRAGTSSSWFTGPTLNSLHGAANLGGGPGGPAPVDSLRPNGFGLHHVHGNVAEWCREEGMYLYQNASHRSGDGLARASGTSRLHRGGSWRSEPRNARSAHRSQEATPLADRAIGIRAVRQIQ